MRKLLALSAIAVTMVATSTAHAEASKEQQVKVQLKRFYHADGFIKAIGRVAYRTIYSSNPSVRGKWQRTMHRLVVVRKDAKRRIALLRTPPAPTYPPHHALWVCIGSREGSPTSVNPNGHYGMLQMHWDWGYGIVGAASNYSQADQEWAAERGYRASGYSRSFLIGQWLEWDGAYDCLAYA